MIGINLKKINAHSMHDTVVHRSMLTWGLPDNRSGLSCSSADMGSGGDGGGWETKIDKLYSPVRGKQHRVGIQFHGTPVAGHLADSGSASPSTSGYDVGSAPNEG